MEEGHRPLWRHFIETIPETNLSTRQILDFGCNRGGFLRLLHSPKPFRQALGVDIAQDSITAARNLAGSAPIEYEVASDLTGWPGRFDIAASVGLALLGYSQNSALILRDVLETVFLIDYFAGDRTPIERWRFAEKKARMKDFGPVKVREALDARDGFTETDTRAKTRHGSYSAEAP
jgi:SAM-dependent methyltransferase